jgi:formylmethanofuran dehydrogenase subunit A
MQQIAAGESARVEAFLAWLIETTGALAPKLVNPGGVEIWKQSGGGHSTGFDDRVPSFDITPRQIVTQIATAANNLRLPHPVHIHCNQLGMPGNWQTTLATMQALGHLRGHLTHIQFHSYRGTAGDESSLASGVAPLVDYLNTHPQLSVDVGQVMFGNTTSMTGDGPLGYYLHQIYGQRWYSGDTECESGCGVMPIEYRNRNLFHALQWAVGLEWFLLAKNPWQVVLSTDHPNGASFLAYPQLIRLLMDREYRREQLATCPAALASKSNLADLDRQYTLGEIATITRAAPARLLGLTHKGHLGPGADADITLYTPHENWATMFELPRMVFKSGELLCEEGQIRTAVPRNTLRAVVDYDREALADLPEWFAGHYSVQLANFGMQPQELAAMPAVADAGKPV